MANVQEVLALFQVMFAFEPSSFMDISRSPYQLAHIKIPSVANVDNSGSDEVLHYQRVCVCLLIVWCKWQLSIIFFTFYLGFHRILNINKVYVHKWIYTGRALKVYKGVSVCSSMHNMLIGVQWVESIKSNTDVMI